MNFWRYLNLQTELECIARYVSISFTITPIKAPTYLILLVYHTVNLAL